MKPALTMILALSLIGSEASGAGTKQNEYVRVEIALPKQPVMPGDNVDLLVTFKPIEGIHITGDPAVKISVSPSTVVKLRGKQSQVVDSSTGYLSTKEPVKQQISLSSTASPGKHLLNADVTYYFCSDEAGWCRKFVQTVELQLILKGGRSTPSRGAK